MQNLTGDPRNLQIFYSGSGQATINITNGADFNGLIYAPNGTVNTVGAGSFNGAIVGRNIKVQLDGRLRLMSKEQLAVQAGSGGGAMSRTPFGINESDNTILSGLRYYAATHQEFSTALVTVPD